MKRGRILYKIYRKFTFINAKFTYANGIVWTRTVF